jgi:hypothetical protein
MSERDATVSQDARPAGQAGDPGAAVVQGADEAGTTSASMPTAAGARTAATGRKAEKELLCTICGLKACWQAPASGEAAGSNG